ncbi:MAG: hypothetical protein L6R41_007871 [Letrouitia leprolyta]|nr:MAG: hypothetical protein L6R41_007871 [Letrouitia leprolyta]
MIVPTFLCIITALFLDLVAGLWPDIELVYVHKLNELAGYEADPRDPVMATCRYIPPGVCCVPHRDELLAPNENLNSIDYGSTGFSRLRTNQFGFGWGARGSEWRGIRCGPGPPILRVLGPTGWAYDPWDDHGGYVTLPAQPSNVWQTTTEGTPSTVVFAAAWIDLRRRVPPNRVDARYLRLQGVKELLWGRNRWKSLDVPFPRRDSDEALDSWASGGTAYLQAPTRWRRPDLYSINGTNYTKFDNQSYKADDGRFLNLTNDIA